MSSFETTSEPGHVSPKPIAPQSPSLSTLELRKIRIAISADSLQNRTFLQQALEERGLNVVLCEALGDTFLQRLDETEAEVLVLDLHDDIELDDNLFDRLLDEAKVPIVFNDVAALTINEPRVLTRWHNTLVRKIAELTGHQNDPATSSEVDLKQAAVDSGLLKVSTDRVLPGEAPRGELAMNVWVLGASLGGPEATKRFLRELPDDLPVAFVLAQHLGANFVRLLAEQLDRETPFRVLQSQVGHVLRHQQVLIAPVEDRLVINTIGTVELHPAPRQSPYSPSIDTVISDIARRYPGRSGAIVFSGMGDDGRLGVRDMAERGGVVWAQDSKSCVISSMPDKVRDTGLVQFSGTPEKLAKELVKHFSTFN
jgi:chemosensory pili system protein ChpB (putative protein-glutamate methylesterase)